MKPAYRMFLALIAAAALAAPAQAQSFAILRLYEEQTREADRQRAIERAREQIERQREAEQRRRREAEERNRRTREAAQELQRGWPEITENLSRTLRLGRNGTLDLQILAGTIVVTGGRGDDVRLDIVKRVRNRSEAEARSLLPRIAIEIVERGGNIDVRTEHPSVRNVYARTDYTISVPAAANVTLRSLSGDIRITNLNGELRVDSVSANVSATGVRRARVLKTMSGNIELADGEADELTASTMSGNLLVRNVKGRFFDIQSVSGTVRLTDVEPDRVHVRSMNGDVEYVGRLARSGRYDFHSHAGDIRITPTTNQGFDVEASTFGGSFRSDYELRLTQDLGNLRGGSRTVRGVFGDGGAAINAQSFAGNIIIIRR